MKQVVAKRNDMAFYLKMFPLASIHPEAYKKSKAIVCEESNEKALAMLEDAFSGKPLPEPACETDVIDRNLKLAESLGIRGTPTLVFQNGKKASGAFKADELIRLIDATD